MRKFATAIALFLMTIFLSSNGLAMIEYIGGDPDRTERPPRDTREGNSILLIDAVRGTSVTMPMSKVTIWEADAISQAQVVFGSERRISKWSTHNAVFIREALLDLTSQGLVVLTFHRPFGKVGEPLDTFYNDWNVEVEVRTASGTTPKIRVDQLLANYRREQELQNQRYYGLFGNTVRRPIDAVGRVLGRLFSSSPAVGACEALFVSL